MTGPIDPRLNPDLLAQAIANPRWNVLARTGFDLATIATWDKRLHRRKRICVPVDVQAFVVPASGGEATVTVRGDSRDPAPFAAGAVRPAGVHLHWALPDSLLRGEPTARDSRGRSEALALPVLPDRWVVLRLLRPRGLTRPLVRGWVIDARTKTTAPLETFSGTFPAGAPDDVFSPLDAGIGGSLIWTASYSASEGRFGFHDPLTDVPPPASLAPNGLHDSSAAYLVGGWWSDLALDPLGANAGVRALAAKLEAFSWLLDDDAVKEVTNNERARRDSTNASIGLVSPRDTTTIEYAPATGSSLVQKVYGPAGGVAMPVKDASQMILATPQPEFATLLHGVVFGVPVSGGVGADDRPAVRDVTVALGQDTDDVVAAFGAGVLGVGDANRDAAERLTAAFTSDLLDRLTTADGISDLAEREHADGFDSRPGPALPGARPDRFLASDAASANPLSIGRKGRGSSAGQSGGSKDIATVLKWADQVDLVAKHTTGKTGKRRTGTRAADAGARTDVPPVREVVRPAPREFFPQPPMLALRGVKPNLRHHGDERFEGGKGLRCRYSEECVSELSGAIRGADVLPSLGSGAIPEEVLAVAREAVLLDPYGMSWLHATITSGLPDNYAKAVSVRLVGEMTRLYGVDATYDGKSHIADTTTVRRAAPNDPWLGHSAADLRLDRELTAQLAAHSIVKGTPPSPVAITTWRQPWVPMWAEWRVVLEGTSSLDGWRLDSLDYSRDGTAPAPTISRTIAGRTPLGTGIAEALHAGIQRWLLAEEQRDQAGNGVLAPGDQAALERLGDFLEPLDMASASLDGVREQLLGIAYVGQMPLDTPAAGTERKPVASALPVPFFGGTLRLDALRVVDAFGRTLDLDVSRITTTRSLEASGAPSSIVLRPRMQHVARWVVRFVGAPDPGAADPSVRPDAFVDQVAPEAMVNPVAGFLLPDHIDESLEVFATDGTPIGELAHDPITGAVTWETAPGRPVPPDAGPFTGLTASQSPIAEVAAGVLLADVTARNSATPPPSSALSSMLRAIDTTLWTVDTYSAIGSPSIAGLVGRPVAVVRATIKLEAPDDTGEVTITDAGGVAARRAIFAALSELQLPFRLGALERSDDALLGFFVGDDFAHLHLVDKVVQSLAPASGRQQGALGQLGSPIDTTSVPIAHPYVVAEDELRVRPGQEIALTLLMLPAGKVHVTSGLLPRKALSLAEDWVGPGLKAICPSVRVGPVLVDPSEIRLPLIRAMGPRQRFTRRTGPLTWRDDPITAATMTAYLPRMPHEAQEGWIRVQPDDESATDGETT